MVAFWQAFWYPSVSVADRVDGGGVWMVGTAVRVEAGAGLSVTGVASWSCHGVASLDPHCHQPLPSTSINHCCQPYNSAPLPKKKSQFEGRRGLTAIHFFELALAD